MKAFTPLTQFLTAALGLAWEEDGTDNVYCIDRREQPMAVIVKYMVVRDGKDDMIFSTKKEAEAYDNRLDIAERVYAFLHTAELNIADDTLDNLSFFMAQHREQLGTLLKGGRLKSPATSVQPATFPQAKEDVSAPVQPQESKATPSPRSVKPKAAA